MNYEMERRKGELPDPPRIYVFCNSCSHAWHTIVAVAADGAGLAGHVCSSHGFIGGDMGFTTDWKHENYDAHYPDGWELVFVEDFGKARATDPKFAAALAAGEAKAALTEQPTEQKEDPTCHE